MDYYPKTHYRICLLFSFVEVGMKKGLIALLVLVSLNLLVGCEVTQELQPGTLVTVTNKDASWFAGWLDHALNGHHNDD